MLTILIVFVVLSLINVLIFLMEDTYHRKLVRKNSDNLSFNNLYSKPILVTTVRAGKLEEDYVFFNQSMARNEAVGNMPKQSRLEELLLNPTLSAN